MVVVLHGGFWRSGHDLGLMRPLCADLVARGWAACNVEYRRLGGGGGYPATLEDVAGAIDALAELEQPLDLDRVVTLGHGAGGHLALWAAARNRSPHRVRVAAAIGQAPVADLEQAARLRLGHGAVQELCGGDPRDVPAVYRAASPAVRLPLGVPQLLVHGGRDDTVPADMSRRYAQAARAGGDDVTLVVREGDGHFEHLDPRSAAWETVVRWLRER